MLPANLPPNTVDGSALDAKLAGNVITVNSKTVKPENLFRLLFRKFVSTVLFSPWSRMPAFSVHIGKVVAVCSRAKVRWVYTPTIVTGVHDNFIVRDITVGDKESNPVGVHCERSPLATEFHSPITARAHTPSPKPTTLARIRAVFPKSINVFLWENHEVPLFKYTSNTKHMSLVEEVKELKNALAIANQKLQALEA